MREYVIWGKPPKEEHETVLHTLAKTGAQAERVRQLLEVDHGCTDTRIQVIDFSQELKWDARKMVKEI